MADEEKIDIVRDANPSLVKQAQAEVGVVFKGELENGRVNRDIVGRKKENAKIPVREDVGEYNSKTMNEPLPDKDPFSLEIKQKNDLAREQIIRLLNPVDIAQGKRNQSIQTELLVELQKEEAKPEPNEKTITALKSQIELTQGKLQKGELAREGIVFPPNEDEKIIIPITPPEKLK